MTLRRKALIFGFALLVLPVVLLFALPLWFPWPHRPALRHFGVRYAAYERVGYSRFALVDTIFAKGATVFRAGRVEGFVPTAWLWHKQLRHTNEVFLQLANWQFEQAAKPGAEREVLPHPTTSL